MTAIHSQAGRTPPAPSWMPRSSRAGSTPPTPSRRRGGKPPPRPTTATPRSMMVNAARSPVDEEEDRSCGTSSWSLHNDCWSLFGKRSVPAASTPLPLRAPTTTIGAGSGRSRWRMKKRRDRCGWSTTAVGCGKSGRWMAQRATKEGGESRRTQ